MPVAKAPYFRAARVINAPLSGAPIFRMKCIINIPFELKLATVRKELEKLGEQMDIDIEIAAADSFQ